jgi:hypothetical protein
MPKMTLLEMTQDILSAMSSDEVNSISDTVESSQVAQEIKNTFFELYSNRDIPELESLVNLSPSGDPASPHTLIFPTNVHGIKWIKYKNFRANNHNFHDVDYLPPEEFIRRIVEADTSDAIPYVDVPLLPTSPVMFPIRTNKGPDFYTIFDNERTIVFDSFDEDYESNLTGSNALAWGVLDTTFQLVDDYVPPLDANLFPHLLAEAKSVCFINIKEVANSKEEQRARRQLIRSQTRMTRTRGQREGIFDADYSRKR